MKPSTQLNRTCVICALAFLAVLICSADAQTITPQSIFVPVSSIVCTFRRAIVEIVGALASVIFVISGIRWIWSQDDPGKRKSAKDAMVHAIVGLIIIGVADEIVQSFNFVGCT
ncbi:MAG: pilin [Candidatus Altiarchaeota archaeon]